MVNRRASAYVGLLPAAGVGSRLPERTLSKELLPFGGDAGEALPVISHLLHAFGVAGITDIIVVLRDTKQDIIDYLATDDWQGFEFSYRLTRGTSGVPQTVALGLDPCGEKNVLFGFPDILFEPRDAFSNLIERLDNTNADIVLGLFPTDTPSKMDMVDATADGRVTDIVIKPEETNLRLTWILAAWRPAFSRYLRRIVNDAGGRLAELADAVGGNHLGHVLQLAIADGMTVGSVAFGGGRTLDIGTPDDLVRARRWKAGTAPGPGRED